MAQDWERLARYIRAEYKRRFGTQQAFAEGAGVSDRMIRDILSGRERSWLPNKAEQIEDALGWPRGAMERVLSGLEPEDPGPPSTTTGMFDDLIDEVLAADIDPERKRRMLKRLYDADAQYRAEHEHLAADVRQEIA